MITKIEEDDDIWYLDDVKQNLEFTFDWSIRMGWFL